MNFDIRILGFMRYSIQAQNPSYLAHEQEQE